MRQPDPLQEHAGCRAQLRQHASADRRFLYRRTVLSRSGARPKHTRRPPPCAMTNLGRALSAVAMAVGATGFAAPTVHGVVASSSERRAPFAMDVIVSGLKTPSAITFLPDGRALVLERASGVADLVDVNLRTVTPLLNLPTVLTGDDAGLHDIVPHPDFTR